MHQPDHPTLIPLFEELRGERVLLRPFQAADVEDFFAALRESRERLLPWDTWPQRCQTLEDVQNLLAYFRADFILRREMEVGIWDQTTTHFLGSMMLRPKDWHIPFFEQGYWLRTSAEGQGYMGESLALLVEFVFAVLGARRVMMRIDERNHRSLALAERLGFVREGCLRNSERAADGTLRNMVIMALTPADRASISWQETSGSLPTGPTHKQTGSLAMDEP
jgi:RimJ/RimL family protein N-acetyltransferase